MAKLKVKKKGDKKPLNPEAKGLFFLAFGFLLFLSLFSFVFLEPKQNWLGLIGYIIALGAEYLFGLASYLIPLYLVWTAIRILRKEKVQPLVYDHIYFLVLLASSSFLLTVFADTFPQKAFAWENQVVSETLSFSYPFPRTVTRYNLGGVPFYFLYKDLPLLNLHRILSAVGTQLIFSSLALVSFLLLTKMKIWECLLFLGRSLASFHRFLRKRGQKNKIEPSKSPSSTGYAGLSKPPNNTGYAGLSSSGLKINLAEEKKGPFPEEKKRGLTEILKPEKPPLKPKEKPLVKEEKALPSLEKKANAPILLKSLPKSLNVSPDGLFELPSPDLLSPPSQKIDQPTLKKDLLRQAAVLEETLKSFGIEAKVGEINSGPTITSFEVHPSIGVKVQKIKALENDIALNMEAKSIRIVAPIPGKAAVGVEVPAIHPQEVSFREMLLHYKQKHRRLQIPFLIGKAVNGDWVLSDLAKMPHLLIAGATGSGKSVCINTLVMSMLMTARPSDLKLLMVDPKKVELTQYSRLPHMIAPVITEPHGAYAALQWLVKEMQVRYEILKQLGLRNITAFNSRKLNKELEASLNIPIPEHMPYIVAIIDEFADLMMVSSADIETPIARIAQMARAVGIHLVLATQRPSREVITGIIKANIPTRISFKVASRVNSQIILDDTGAESLLGNGDLLFLPPGSSQLLRAQGAYISDEDINKVTDYLIKKGPPEYLIPSFDSFRSLETDLSSGEPSGKDSLYDQALTLVLAAKTASTTYLQRKLKIGYARAASLMDELEENGVIGPQEGSRPRRVLSNNSGGPLAESFEEEEDLPIEE